MPRVTAIRHKRGDTLAIGVAETAGPTAATQQPVDLTGYTIRAQVRDERDVLLAEFSVTIDEPRTLGTYVLGAAANVTAAWPLGSYLCDIELRSGDGVVESSETFVLRVEADITHDEAP